MLTQSVLLRCGCGCPHVDDDDDAVVALLVAPGHRRRCVIIVAVFGTGSSCWRGLTHLHVDENVIVVVMSWVLVWTLTSCVVLLVLVQTTGQPVLVPTTLSAWVRVRVSTGTPTGLPVTQTPQHLIHCRGKTLGRS